MFKVSEQDLGKLGLNPHFVMEACWATFDQLFFQPNLPLSM